MRQYLKRISVGLSGLLLVLGITVGIYQPVFGFDERYDAQFYANNNILFYNPEDTTCGESTGLYSGPTDIKSLKDTAENKAIFLQLISNGTHTVNAVMAVAIMGNMYGESGMDPEAQEPNGPGYGLAQWSTEGRKQGLENYAKEQGGDKSDASIQVGYLLKEYNESFYGRLAGSDFDNASDISRATKKWMEVFENPLEQDGPDPSGLNSRRIPAALAFYGFYKDLPEVKNNPAISGTATAEVSAQNCASGIASGDIVATAIGLALTEPFPDGNYVKSAAMDSSTGYTLARDTYQAAKPKYNPSVAWTDCGGYVATVMRASGVDPEYASVGVSTQIAYARSHPEKYLVIDNANASQLQPGDILSSTVGHTTIYTGAATYPNADASYGVRVPSVRNAGNHTWMLGNNASIIRFIGSTSGIVDTAVGSE